MRLSLFIAMPVFVLLSTVSIRILFSLYTAEELYIYLNSSMRFSNPRQFLFKSIQTKNSTSPLAISNTSHKVQYGG